MVQEKEGVNKYGDGIAWVRGSMIGKGGFCSVFLATLKNSKNSKYRYYPSLMAVKSVEVSRSVSVQKEMDVLCSLNGCSDIITYIGHETTIGDNGLKTYNLLLEYASGGTLTDRIKKSGGSGLPEFEARVYTRSILRGLNHVHGSGYVHRDLKPDNILLMANCGKSCITEFRAKIGDFGMAKRVVQSKKRRLLEPYWNGTPMYLSPEAVIDKVQEAPCDIWALGCVVLEMLTGKHPWNGKKAKEVLEKIGAEDQLPNIPSEISEEARGFLKGYFVRNSRFRFTAEMLLHQPFVQGLKDEDLEEEEQEEDINETEPSILSVSENDDEFCSGSFSSWSEENVEESEGVIKRPRIDKSNEKPKQIPVSCIIAAGV